MMTHVPMVVIGELISLKRNTYSYISIMYIEQRIKTFQGLHNNKWFHIMNWSLDIIKTYDKQQRYILTKYGSCFYF
jgi:hypothetical protein